MKNRNRKLVPRLMFSLSFLLLIPNFILAYTSLFPNSRLSDNLIRILISLYIFLGGGGFGLFSAYYLFNVILPLLVLIVVIVVLIFKFKKTGKIDILYSLILFIILSTSLYPLINAQIENKRKEKAVQEQMASVYKYLEVKLENTSEKFTLRFEGIKLTDELYIEVGLWNSATGVKKYLTPFKIIGMSVQPNYEGSTPPSFTLDNNKVLVEYPEDAILGNGSEINSLLVTIREANSNSRFGGRIVKEFLLYLD